MRQNFFYYSIFRTGWKSAISFFSAGRGWDIIEGGINRPNEGRPPGGRIFAKGEIGLQKWIVDTDAAFDDVAALIAALRLPSVEVLAVTTVAGRVSAAQGRRNAALARQLAGEGMPPIDEGCARPLVQPAPRPTQMPAGADGLFGEVFARPRTAARREQAVNAMIRLLLSEEKVTVLTLGPLTNLALALRKEPKIAGRIERVVMAAGSGLSHASYTATAEFNAYTDPHAADLLLNAGLPVLLLPDELLRQGGLLGEAQLARLSGSQDPAAGFCLRVGAHLRQDGRQGFSLPKAAAVLCCAQPERILRASRCRVRVDTQGEATLGQTILDEKAPEEERTVTVADALDQENITRQLCALLCGEKEAAR